MPKPCGYEKDICQFDENAAGIRKKILDRPSPNAMLHNAGEHRKWADIVTTTDGADQRWIRLIARIRTDRDQAAFAELFRHFAPRIKGFLIKSGSPEPVAEDCVQEVLATVWRKAHLFDPTRASVATWIFTIARNKRIDFARKAARPAPEDLPWGPEPDPDQADALAMQQDCAALADAIKRLPEAQRALIHQAYFGEMSHSEIAAETGLALGTIKSRIRLGLSKLKEEMNPP